MAIKIGKKHLDLIKAYGEQSYPNECCGFLLGKQNNDDKEVLTTFPAFNASEDDKQFHRFLITSETYLHAERFAKKRDMEIIGFYHSHPNSEAEPSAYDIERGWPWYSYIIVSVKNKRAQIVSSWILESDRSKFMQEKIIIN